jgi:hypothetical protein
VSQAIQARVRRLGPNARQAIGVAAVLGADWPPFLSRLRHDPPHLYVLASFATSPDPGGFAVADSIRDDTRWANQAHEALVEPGTR